MYRSLAPLLAAVLAAGVPAQEPAQESLVDQYQHKIERPFVTVGGWLVDYEAALARARDEGKVVFVYYTRSYAP